uniref:Uncharacterized protein n=1 Tax=Arundo donax TaxID=35708 RepID=A0A0A9A0Y7_ARUDO
MYLNSREQVQNDLFMLPELQTKANAYVGSHFHELYQFLTATTIWTRYVKYLRTAQSSFATTRCTNTRTIFRQMHT